jgi:hypothetical protein
VSELERQLYAVFEACRSGNDRLNLAVMDAIREAARIGSEMERAACAQIVDAYTTSTVEQAAALETVLRLIRARGGPGA